MLSNMFTIAWRNATRHKQFTILNILGLSLGITACLLIGLYIQNELRYDQHFENKENIYRINQSAIWGDWNEDFSSTAPNVAIAMREDLPEFEEVTRMHAPGEQFFSYKNPNGDPKSFKEGKFFLADSNFFDIFSFEFLLGDPDQSFQAPGNLILTEETAQRYFGEEDPIGKVIDITQGENQGALMVTGVVKNIPKHSHIQFDMLATMYTFSHIKSREWTWIWTTFVTYGKLKPNVDLAALNAKLQLLPPKWSATTMKRVFSQSYDEFIGDNTWHLTMQPLTEAYLFSPPTGNRVGPAGSIQYVQIFGAVGILILLLSSINFMNLSTARSSNRAKEVGIRKVLGSGKRQLVAQFIFESVLFVFISTVVAVIVTELSLDSFNQIANKELTLYSQLNSPILLGGLVTFIIGLGILSGSYPAFYLSSFQPIKILKGKMTSGFKGKQVRNALVVFQFTISIALILSTLFVQKQLNYTANFELGFEKENLLQIHNVEVLGSETQTLKSIAERNPSVLMSGISDLTPPNVYNEDKYKAFGPDKDIISLNRMLIDDNYLNLINPQFLLGRNFDKSRPADKSGVIINQAALKALGWSATTTDLSDKFIVFPWSEEMKFKVIGVVEDFNFNSLRSEILPLILMHEDNQNDNVWDAGVRTLSLKLNPEAVSTTAGMSALIKSIEQEIKKINEGAPFEYSFLDEDFGATFRSEQRLGSVLRILTIMAVVIASLGLFGLAAFSAEQRKKELGVRKVLGASVRKLVFIFTSEFTVLIIISIVLASPLAYLFVQQWLTDFAYKTPIELWVFMVAGISAVLISWLTIGFQSLRAANQNPVDVLRDE